MENAVKKVWNNVVNLKNAPKTVEFEDPNASKGQKTAKTEKRLQMNIGEVTFKGGVLNLSVSRYDSNKCDCSK